MLCLVSQADSVIIEVEVDSKDKGKQCLDKVSYVFIAMSTKEFGVETTYMHLNNAN